MIAAVADCELFADRKGAAAWTRVQDMYDPQGLTTVVNRCITLMSTFQNGADAKTHVAAMDRVTAEAMRSFTLPNGAYDYAKFGKVMLAVIYHVSFDDTTRDELRHGMRNRDLSTYTVQHIRLTALEDQKIAALGRSSERRQGVALYTNAGTPPRGYRGGGNQHFNHGKETFTFCGNSQWCH